MSRRSNAVAAVLAGLFAMVLAGCPSDPYDPNTWVEKLESGNGDEAKEAFQRLVQLKNPAAIDPLGKFWEKHNYPSTVLRQATASCAPPSFPGQHRTPGAKTRRRQRSRTPLPAQHRAPPP